jgi:hypothetical protein
VLSVLLWLEFLLVNANHLKSIVVSLCLATHIAAVAPSSTYSVPGQKRTRTSVPMKGTKIALRFADGSPTGFYAWANDPSSTGNNGDPSPVGDVELDAQEILKSATGQSLYFHPGGAFYKDVTNDGQYGHVLATDLKSLPKLSPVGLNGKAAPLATNVYAITPTRIPPDMYYKANVVNGSSGSTYYTYGNPGYDKTGGRGDWTYLNWSWVQNGGSSYPGNITGGGGLVRALGKRDALFRACDVAPIVGYSYGKDNLVNGRVTAFYGLMRAGPGNKGSDIFGWLVQSYQKTGQPLVLCVKRTTGTVTASAAPIRSDDQLARMALNTGTEEKFDPKKLPEILANFSKRYTAAANAMDRMEVLTAMSRVESSAMTDLLIDLLNKEQDSLVRQQTIIVLGFMRSTDERMKQTCDAFAATYRRTADPAERSRIVEVASNTAAPETIALLRELRADAAKTPAERLELAEGIYKLAPRTDVDPSLLGDVTGEVEAIAKNTSDSPSREHALHILAAPDRQHQAFLAAIAKNESSPKIRAFLNKAIEESSDR